MWFDWHSKSTDFKIKLSTFSLVKRHLGIYSFLPQCCMYGTGKQSSSDFIKWKHFPRYWPFVREMHRPPVNSLNKGQGRGAFMFSLIWARANSWENNRDAGDLRSYYAHYDVTVTEKKKWCGCEQAQTANRQAFKSLSSDLDWNTLSNIQTVVTHFGRLNSTGDIFLVFKNAVVHKIEITLWTHVFNRNFELMFGCLLRPLVKCLQLLFMFTHRHRAVAAILQTTF